MFSRIFFDSLTKKWKNVTNAVIITDIDCISSYILFDTAVNLFEILYMSKGSPRLWEWIRCFEIMFDVTPPDILADYLALRNGLY